jgi:type I restriction enzyme S subunit
MNPKANISNLFLLYWAEASQQIIKSHANGSTFLEISKSNFRTIEMVRPAGKVMAAFDRLIRPTYERLINNERESAMLAALRDALLPKLIYGEIRVHPQE